jgi:ABC-type branched-subunit amino acid transport system permease subunit
VLLQQVLSDFAEKWHLWMGIIIILLVLFLPGGMISLLDRLKGLWQGRRA